MYCRYVRFVLTKDVPSFDWWTCLPCTHGDAQRERPTPHTESGQGSGGADAPRSCRSQPAAPSLASFPSAPAPRPSSRPVAVAAAIRRPQARRRSAGRLPRPYWPCPAASFPWATGCDRADGVCRGSCCAPSAEDCGCGCGCGCGCAVARRGPHGLGRRVYLCGLRRARGEKSMMLVGDSGRAGAHTSGARTRASPTPLAAALLPLLLLQRRALQHTPHLVHLGGGRSRPRPGARAAAAAAAAPAPAPAPAASARRTGRGATKLGLRAEADGHRRGVEGVAVLVHPPRSVDLAHIVLPLGRHLPPALGHERFHGAVSCARRRQVLLTGATQCQLRTVNMLSPHVRTRGGARCSALLGLRSTPAGAALPFVVT